MVAKQSKLELSMKYLLNKLSFGFLFNSEETRMLKQAEDHIKKELDIY